MPAATTLSSAAGVWSRVSAWVTLGDEWHDTAPCASRSCQSVEKVPLWSGALKSRLSVTD